jgi:hypothetical protein
VNPIKIHIGTQADCGACDMREGNGLALCERICGVPEGAYVLISAATWKRVREDVIDGVEYQENEWGESDRTREMRQMLDAPKAVREEEDA